MRSVDGGEVTVVEEGVAAQHFSPRASDSDVLLNRFPNRHVVRRAIRCDVISAA